MGSTLDHWFKPDHLAFLFILPCIILGFFQSRFLMLGVGFWMYAFIYDLQEDED